MLIQITNTCMMGCPHCLQDSTPISQHMTWENVLKAHEFARKSDTYVILISGGEPTEHPKFKEIVELFLDFPKVVIVSNGQWKDNKQKVADMEQLMLHENVMLQITSIQGIYPKIVDVNWFNRFPNTLVHTGEIHIKALGRAATNEKFSRMATEDKYTMSCLSAAAMCAQLPYQEAVKTMELRGMFCHPLIDFKGYIHWSESCLCPSFGNVNEDFDILKTKAEKWRPCCKCTDYKKLLQKDEESYKMVRKLLNI